MEKGKLARADSIGELAVKRNMNMDEKANTSNTVLVSLISLLVGAALSYFATMKIQEEKLWYELRAKAYISYIENTAKINTYIAYKGYASTIGIPYDTSKLEDSLALRDAARFSIALYGSKDVVIKMANYAPFELGGETKEWDKASVELFDAMRNDLLHKDSERVAISYYDPIIHPRRLSKAVTK